MADEPVAHLLVPGPPWRAGWHGVTGCGHRADKVAGSLLDVAEFNRRDALRPADMGLCRTCRNPAWRWRNWSWDRDPVAVIADDCGWPNRSGRRARLAVELRALGALAAAHPEEFAELLENEQVMSWMIDEHDSGVRRR
jgi:hypothetical protein